MTNPVELLSSIKGAIDGQGQALEAFSQKTRDDVAALRDRIEEIEASRGNLPSASASKVAHPLAALEEDDAFKALRAGKGGSARVEVKGLGQAIIQGKSLIAGDGYAGSPATGYPVFPARIPGIFDIRRPLDFLSVVPSVPAGQTNTVQFVRLTGEEIDAGVQSAEGEAKAVKQFDFELDTAPVRTFAVTASASRQVLDDAAGLRDFLTSRMLYECRALLESEIITGSSSLVSGIAEEAVQYSTSATTAADRIGDVVANLRSRSAGDVIVVLNPTDWQAIAAERTSAGEYVNGGGWAVPAEPRMWNSNVTVSSSVALNTGLVLARDAIRLFPREDAMVLFGYNNDDFTRNIIRILVELRAAFAVTQPGLVYKVAV